MLLSAPTSVIYIDTNEKTVNFAVSAGGEAAKLEHSAVGYNADIADDGFFSEFQKILREYSSCRKSNFDKTVLILPDRFFITDTVRIPAVGRRTSSASLSAAISSLYKNSGEICFNTYPRRRGGELDTYGIVGIRRELYDRFRQCCDTECVSIKTVTFASNSAVNGVFALCPDLRAADFLLLCIKRCVSHFSFVKEGKTVGYYSLPFGYDVFMSETDVNADVGDTFRIFSKATLMLSDSNPDITGAGGINTVVVDLPLEYAFVLDNINEELADKNIRFRPLFERPAKLPLELFGAMFVKQYNKINNF